MNQRQKFVLTAAFVIILISVLIWFLYGAELFTKTQVLIEKKDELFPEMVYKEWEDKFVWGLDLTALISGAAVLLSGLLIYFFRTKKV